MPTQSSIDILANRVRRISTAAMIVTVIMMAYFVTLFIIQDATEYSLLGKGLASLGWGCSFLYPHKLANWQNTQRRKLAAFGLLLIALFSSLLWFPLASIIIKP